MMQPEDDRNESSNPPDLPPVDAVFKTLVDYLEAERARIVEEIRSYPPPIPACDAQFNYLLEKRTTLSRELDRLYRIDKALLAGESGVKRLRVFIESSDCIESHTKRRLAAACREQVPK